MNLKNINGNPINLLFGCGTNRREAEARNSRRHEARRGREVSTCQARALAGCEAVDKVALTGDRVWGTSKHMMVE